MPISSPLSDADPRLRALLQPRSVALVGASDDGSKPSGRPLRYLRRDGFEGVVYPVNPTRSEVQGEPAFASLAELPETPDHVFVMTPTETVVGVIQQCAELGVPAASILSDGFAEAGPEGQRRLDELRNVASAGGVRLLGPNSIGMVDTRSGLTLTANAAFVEGGLPAGRSMLVSQSGSMIGALVSRGRARGIGFASVVSVGSESDISVGELCLAALDDPGIGSYTLFLENLSNGDDLRVLSAAAAERGRPVVVYKLGRSDAGAELSRTHTGAIAGDEAVAEAFFADLGFARVDTIEGLIEATALAPTVPPNDARRRPRVGVVTATGGGAAMVVDQLGVRGVNAEPPSAATLARLVEAIGYPVHEARIVDLTLRGTSVSVMSAALDILRTCGEYDLVVQTLGSSAASAPESATEPARTASAPGAPLAVFVVPEAPEALDLLGAANVPAFRTPEACADAVAALLQRRTPSPAVSSRVESVAGEIVDLSEPEGYALLAQVGIDAAPSITVDPQEVSTVRLPFDYPVVAKAVAEGLVHKSDAGGVIVGIQDASELAAAGERLRAEAGARQVLVQRQLDAVVEVLVGFRRDPQVGPIVVVSAGGVLAELAPDPSIRLAPIDFDTARFMVDEVTSVSKLIGGYRGKPAGDADSLARVVAAVSQLALRPEVIDAEINPVMVTSDGATAVDALVRVTR